MPLHDWTDRSGWEGLHIYWMTEIARGLRAALPAGYRAVIGSSPLVAIGVSPVKPDVAITNGRTYPLPGLPAIGTTPEPDIEVAVATLEDDTTVLVEREGRLIAAIELISPRNKDRPLAREQYGARYVNYLRGGVNLMIVDVHRRPLDFSFSKSIAASLAQPIATEAAPSVVSYRIGGPAAQGGRMLGVWHHPLVIGEPIPSIPLALSPDVAVMIDLDSTYSRAAADSYIA